MPFPINEESSDKFPANDGAVPLSGELSEKTTEKTTEKILCIIKNSCTLLTDLSSRDARGKE